MIGIFVVGVAGCGSEDFENNPRPPAPIELTANIDSKKVIVSPNEADGQPIGAGLVNLTISNLTDQPEQLTFTGPSDESSDPIIPGGVANFKLELLEGDYVVEADGTDIKPFDLTVGPERPSSQNDLLLP